MGAIEALKKGFAVATKNLGLVSVFFIFSLIGNFIRIWVAQVPSGARVSTAGVAIQLLILGVLIILVDIFIRGGILGGISDYIKEGKTSLAGVAKYGLKYYLRLLGLFMAIIAAFIAVILAVFLIMSAMIFPKMMILAGAAALLIAGIGSYWVILLAAMSPYAIVCEELTIMAAMAKSVKITRRGINKVVSLFLMTILISLLWMAALKFIPINNQALRAILVAIFSGYFGIVFMASYMSLYLSIITNDNK